MRSKLGVTASVATVSLALIAVGSTAVVYEVLDSSAESVKDRDIQVNLEDVSAESCWVQGDVTYISMRNTGGEASNLTEADLVLDGNPASAAGFNMTKYVVNPQETFIVRTNESVSTDTTLKLVTDAYRKSFYCEDIPSVGGSGPGSVPFWEGGGSIPGLQMDGNMTYPSSSSLCIGRSCSFSTSSSPSTFDSNDYVNKHGDVMSGDLNTSRIVKMGSILCIGQGCQESTTGAVGEVSESQTYMEGFMRVETFMPHPDGACIGGNC